MKINPNQFNELNELALELQHGPDQELRFPAESDADTFAYLDVVRHGYGLVTPRSSIHILGVPVTESPLETATVRLKGERLIGVDHKIGRLSVAALLIPQQREAFFEKKLDNVVRIMRAAANAKAAYTLR